MHPCHYARRWERLPSRATKFLTFQLVVDDLKPRRVSARPTEMVGRADRLVTGSPSGESEAALDLALGLQAREHALENLQTGRVAADTALNACRVAGAVVRARQQRSAICAGGTSVVLRFALRTTAIDTFLAHTSRLARQTRRDLRIDESRIQAHDGLQPLAPGVVE